jgi:hypothetical protein
MSIKETGLQTYSKASSLDLEQRRDLGNYLSCPHNGE